VLRARTREVALLRLATGIDPAGSCAFVQSHVREHLELSYLLECTTYVGELSRMVQFKEKGGRPRTRASLFT
jgi:tryptophanyl-tRNA synthetase